ncbi:TadE/TadG family type IV pilus assembly protein [Magnetovibrio sp. PR-2]|uniref:vWA domain-containing protein n=1 Tax=Magnetovibrio sp. PR-2 TaxID=3120356 RepID=UPI002FCDE68F
MSHIQNRLQRVINAFRTAERGAVAIMVALAMVPLMLAAGISMDIGRAYIVKQRLLQTTDAAALAIAAGIDNFSTDAELTEILNDFVDANYEGNSYTSISSRTYSYVDTDVNVTLTASVDTTFMSIVSIDSLDVAASSSVTRSEDTMEVVLVLDNSGSMDGSRMTALKDASNSLLDILFGTSTVSSQVSVGLVPFSNNVNIGTSNTAYVNDPTAYNWGITSWGGCVMAKTTNDEDTKDDFEGPWDVMWWDDDGNNNWYSSGRYYNTSSRSPNKYCVDSAITPLTNDKSVLQTAVNNMDAFGGTHINLGAIWGWRVISPTEPFAEGQAYNASDNNKAVIILTDGENTAYDFVYDAFGYPSDELLGSGINTVSEVEDEIDDRLETICTNIKNVGVTVYTITFGTNDAATQAIFEACATDEDKYYDSPTTDELKRTFRSIASELKQLHIVN